MNPDVHPLNRGKGRDAATEIRTLFRDGSIKNVEAFSGAGVALGRASLPPPSLEVGNTEVEFCWRQSARNGPPGSRNAFPWPPIDCVVDSGEVLRLLFEGGATALVTEKLDGSNICLHSNGVVASRRVVLANNSSMEDFKSLRCALRCCLHHFHFIPVMDEGVRFMWLFR